MQLGQGQFQYVSICSFTCRIKYVIPPVSLRRTFSPNIYSDTEHVSRSDEQRSVLVKYLRACLGSRDGES